MKRSMLLVVTAVTLLTSGFVLYRMTRATPVQAAPSEETLAPSSYRHGQQLSGSSLHYCLRSGH